MRSAPTDLDVGEIEQALVDGWDVRVASIAYVPEGGGSHHWQIIDDRGAAHFVTVDDLDDKGWIGTVRDTVCVGLEAALRTSLVLRAQEGLDFVLPPVPTNREDVLRRINDRYTVSVFPYLRGTSHPFGPYADLALRVRALDMVAALHSRTEPVLELAPSHDGFDGPEDLAAYLDNPDDAWDGGPFAAPAFALIHRHLPELAELVAGFDRLVQASASAWDATVITHGEPHPANLLSVDDAVYLIDWDTTALAPPERDLWLVVADDSDIERYERASGRRVDRSVLLLYELRWYIGDLDAALRMFRSPHVDNGDTQRWFEGLAPRLARLPAWLERLA